MSETTGPAQRTPEAETYAEQARAVRADLAHRLRAAWAGDLRPEHLRLLQRARYMQDGHSRPYPNPDRRSDCQRHADRARETLENLRGVLELEGSPRAQAALAQLQASADLYALLAATASH